MAKQINWFEKFLGSGFYTGYIPFASGTFGSISAIVIYLIPGFENLWILSGFILLFFVIGVFISGKFEDAYGHDPSECTIDEVVGTWIALWALPKNLVIVLISFFIWRVLDIVKPFPARKLESLKSGWGIMMDDVAAGIYSAVIVHLIIYLFGDILL